MKVPRPVKAVQVLLPVLLLSLTAAPHGQSTRAVDMLPDAAERWALVIGVSKYDDSEGLTELYGNRDAETFWTGLGAVRREACRMA